MFTKIGFLLLICFTNSVIPPSYLCLNSFVFFEELSTREIAIPLFKNASSLILLSSIDELNFIEEKISFDGKKVIFVPFFFEFPTFFKGLMEFPSLKFISNSFPSLKIFNSSLSERAFTTETPTPCNPPETLYES